MSELIDSCITYKKRFEKSEQQKEKIQTIMNDCIDKISKHMLTEDGKVERPDLGSGDPMDAFVLEISAVVEAVNSSQPAQFLMGDLARDAIVICQKQTESVRTGRRVEM